MRAVEPIMQVGYVVTDLDAAIAHWLEHTGIGPWTVFRGVRLDGTYRGGMRELIAHGIEQARDWDGTDPVRTLG
ncbi:VOC family protein [Nocardia asteroides]|uniref:VOC family protein n=1 Tax=Nocardia asteroides TaxID=1824 RepID=UPI001E5FE761|nr:VOC family protein [Nocardia asteroides]UGT55897.1 VOC family protein [Nocardia asteroides]